MGTKGTTHAILDGNIHDDTVAQAVTRGSLIYGTSAPAWDELSVGTANEVLGTDGTDVIWRSLAEAGIQAQDAVLDDLAALSAVADNEFIVGTGVGTYAHESGATARTSLGVAIGTDVQAFDALLGTRAFPFFMGG